MQSFWLRLVAFGTYALALAEPFEGDMLAVSGDLRYSAFTGRTGSAWSTEYTRRGWRLGGGRRRSRAKVQR